jgi:hypothetical protein
MNKTIFKYSWPNLTKNVPDAKALFLLPIGSEILCFKLQYDWPTIWVICDEEKEKEERHFQLIGTGHAISTTTRKENYIGTVLMYSGELVLHAFETSVLQKQKD